MNLVRLRDGRAASEGASISVQVMVWGIDILLELGSVDSQAEWGSLPVAAKPGWAKQPAAPMGGWHTPGVMPVGDWRE